MVQVSASLFELVASTLACPVQFLFVCVNSLTAAHHLVQMLWILSISARVGVGGSRRAQIGFGLRWIAENVYTP